jgi:uncharacterized protein with PIN domain
MPNISGEQRDVKYCPACKANLTNVQRDKMKSIVKNREGSIPAFTHTYICKECGKKFEINQDR